MELHFYNLSSISIFDIFYGVNALLLTDYLINMGIKSHKLSNHNKSEFLNIKMSHSDRKSKVHQFLTPGRIYTSCIADALTAPDAYMHLFEAH